MSNLLSGGNVKPRQFFVVCRHGICRNGSDWRDAAGNNSQASRVSLSAARPPIAAPRGLSPGHGLQGGLSRAHLGVDIERIRIGRYPSTARSARRPLPSRSVSRRHEPYSTAAMEALKKTEVGPLTATPHTPTYVRYPAREVAETALAHVIGDKAEQAYRRGDALDKRRALMDACAAYCEPRAGGQCGWHQHHKTPKSQIRCLVRSLKHS